MRLRSYFGRLQDAMDRFEETLQSVAPPAGMGALELPPALAADTSYCTNGHPGVVHSASECPVCAVKRAIGYSEKWCDLCNTVTPHVGGMHVHASCVHCLSQRELIRAYLRA
jgi:hypothetical protein